MTKIRLLIVTYSFILSCASNDSSPSDKETDSQNKKENNISNKFGNWEQDNEGNKFREDYELRDLLRGHELVKYTHTDGGQFGGSSGKTKFTLCSDGSMKYYHQTLTTVSADGTGGSNATEEEDYGTWKAVETADGYKMLMTQSAKYNTTGFMEIILVGSNIRIVRFKEWQEFNMKKIDC